MKLRFDSILGKVVLIQLVTLGVIALALFAASQMLLGSQAVRFERRSLRSHAQTLASALSLDAQHRVRLSLPAPERDYYARGLGGLNYTIMDEDGTVLETSRPPDRPPSTNPPHKGAPVYFQSSDRLKSYVQVNVPVQLGERQLWVRVTRKIRHPQMLTGDVAAYVFQRIIWYAIPIVLFCFAVSVIVTRRMLGPVRAVSEMAGAIDPTRLDTRLPAATLPQEIVPLVLAVNRSLSTLEKSFNLQRDFTAYAAHELRTPLSILRMQIDGLRDRDAANALREDIDAMSHIVDQLLSAAEFEGIAVSPNDRADLHQVCSDVVAFMAPLALSGGRELALSGCEMAVPVRGNASMLFQAIRNLVENALKYSPPASCVTVELDEQGVVRVLDEGPGIPEEQRELVFRRFWRGDRSRTNGAGLGLAIVSRVAEAHGGAVTVTNRTSGGAVFSLDLKESRLRAPATSPVA